MTGRRSENEEEVQSAIRSLRERPTPIFGRNPSETQGRILRAFAAFASLWEERLRTGWTPPADSSFPWAQVRLSLAALLPGFANAGDWLARSGGAEPITQGAVTALVLAGEYAASCLVAGRRRTAGRTRGFCQAKPGRDSLDPSFRGNSRRSRPRTRRSDPLDLWPGDDERTNVLVQMADAVIAYGSDASIAALRGLCPARTPFFPFGHAVSIGIVAADGADEAGQFARDILLYDQGGCLSAQAVLAEDQDVVIVAQQLAQSLQRESAALDIPPVTDPAVARTVRQARDMALFVGSDVSVIGDPGLRWTVITRSSPAPLNFPPDRVLFRSFPCSSTIL